MTLRTALVPFLAAVALSSIGCAAESGEAAGSSEANETSSTWRITEIGGRPNHDVGENERVSFAIDGAGHRHAVYLSNDLKTHYIDFSTNQDVAIPANQTSHAFLALDAQGQPHVAFTSDQGVSHASKKNGQWVVEAIGVYGSTDAIAVDAAGTVHIASDSTSAGGEWTATVSTLPAGASAFQHANVPGKVPGEIGFTVNGFAVDRQGGEYLMLSSINFVDDSPTSSHSTDEHAYFVRRPAGGAFSVELMDKSLQNSAASLAIDSAGTIHAVVAGPSGAPDVSTAPYYIHRGANDTAWSAPEKIHWDGYWTSMAVDGSGIVKVAISGDRSNYAAYAERSALGQWSIHYVTTSDTQVPSLALDPSGKPVFAFRTYGGYSLAEPTN
jgi:hypothetical protein